MNADDGSGVTRLIENGGDPSWSPLSVRYLVKFGQVDVHISATNEPIDISLHYLTMLITRISKPACIIFVGEGGGSFSSCGCSSSD
jgi:hypothetical protein